MIRLGGTKDWTGRSAHGCGSMTFDRALTLDHVIDLASQSLAQVTMNDISGAPMSPELLKQAIDCNATWVTTKDASGALPLHLLCQNRRITPDALSLILQANPSQS